MDTGEAERIVEKAWRSLPGAQRQLLEAIGAHQRCVVDEPLGSAIDSLRISAGLPGLTREARERLSRAYGAWAQELRLLFINASHPDLMGLSDIAAERFIARVAWHEWGHALSITRCSPEDVFDGRKLLEKCPEGVREGIRAAGYGPQSYTHEIVAEIYALLVERRIRGEVGRPEWLDGDVYNFVVGKVE